MDQLRNKLSDQLLLLAVVLSGFAALAFEIVWTRILSLLLGAEMIGVLGVLTGFFGGMMLGAWLTNGHAARDKTPLKTFMKLELVVAIYGLLLPHLFFTIHEQSPQWFTSLFSVQADFWSLTLAVLFSGLLMLPATFCMGANFAYLVSADYQRLKRKKNADRAVGRIYAANTLGAVLGTLTSVYLFLPALGFIWGSVCFAAVSLLAVLAAYVYDKKGIAGSKVKKQIATTVSSGGEKASSKKHWLVLLFLTGLLSIAYEIGVVHGLKQVLENTVYSFANILSVYLLGAATGSWWYQSKKNNPKRNRLFVQWCLFGLTLFPILNMLLAVLIANDRAFIAENSLAFGFNLLLEWVITAMFFFVPSFVMGVLFPAIFHYIDKKNNGRAYALNTLGSTLAPFVFGVVLLPITGGQWLLWVVGLCYAILLIVWRKNLQFGWIHIALAGSVLLLGLAVPKNPFLNTTLPKGWQVLKHKEGYQGSVMVSELPGQRGPLGLPTRILQVNGKFRMGGGASFLEKRMGHLPILQHASVDTILFLGLGTATTLGTALEYPLNDVTGVEIQPEIVDFLPLFSDFHNNATESDKTQIYTADARNFVKRTEKQYDLIVCDLYHPARDGAGMLYTQEHYKNLKAVLSDDGAVMQWLPVYQISTDDLKMILRTFLTVFEEAHLFIASYNVETPVVGIYGSKKPVQWHIGRIHNLLYKNNIRASVENTSDVVSSYICGPSALQEAIGHGPLNTDRHPRLIFNAPRDVYTPQQELAHDNVNFILTLRMRFPSELLTMSGDKSLEQRLRKQWQATGLYLEYLYAATTGNEAQARSKLIKAYHLAPEFSPARGMVQQLIENNELSPSILMH